ALMRRIHEAKLDGAPEVVIWGSGTPEREFLYVDDLARASLFLLENYDSPETINVGVGRDLSIHALAELIAETVGYDGELRQDTSKPDGTPKKVLDVTRINDLGWSASTDLRAGIATTYDWYRQHVDALRVK
ncbi:MAG: NAD-dependent epimerase/dehydratase family protein, partial [Acidobacteriota bacterium]